MSCFEHTIYKIKYYLICCVVMVSMLPKLIINIVMSLILTVYFTLVIISFYDCITWDHTVVFKWRLGGRKTNFLSNLIANMETRTTLHLGFHSLYTTNNSTLIFSFSLGHRSSLHESQIPTDLKPRVSSFYPSSISSKKPKSLVCVCLILTDNAYTV